LAAAICVLAVVCLYSRFFGEWVDQGFGADAFQVKSLSENRFVRKIGQVTVDQMEEIASAIALCIGAP
jgi:hypothetical protein